MTILLDTSVIIDVLRKRRGRHELLAEWLRQGHAFACCAINITEVYEGMRRNEERTTARLFEDLDYVEIVPHAARQAGDLLREWQLKGRTLSLPDAIIAALALERDLPLATDDKKDFPMSALQFVPLPGA
ncbi:MAG TPA: type II toxin-antitoxin system VapC family toxin [Terriglobia bacterium]|nr:type II toxin-antitoxin system VapC family toxin [Terriglobia bacterium]